ncbi:MAG TPA: hypothetical protein VFC79_01020 [Tissierellaceae bacterium]|nr:hypothetical protein [Clostridium sp.]HZJ98554.1 hypothetical protein [Tissierellaceae bacterium]
MAKMPRVDYVPGTEKGVINVQLTKPTTINTGNPSAFPMAADVFKNLNYQTAQQSELNTQMKEYYEILARIMGGNTKSGDMQQLENLTGQIREFVLTDDDYNLVIGALQNMQTYVISFMYGDITRKAQAMDVELNKVITEIDRFMTQLEETYSKSPQDYPIPNNSVYREKLEAGVIETLEYTDAIEGVIVSNTKPANPQRRKFIWYNTGAKR